jgi:hypothetical protein
MRFSRMIGAVALASLFAGTAMAQIVQRPPSETFAYCDYTPGSPVCVSGQLSATPGFDVQKYVDGDGLAARLNKITNDKPIVQFVHLPTNRTFSGADVANTIVSGVSKHTTLPADYVLVAIGRGNDTDGNGWHWVPGVRVGSALQSFISPKEIADIVAKGVSKFSMQDGNTSADPAKFAAYVESSVSSTIASNGGPGHSSPFWPWLLVLIFGAAGGFWYVKKTTYPLPEFARAWR